MVNQSSITFTHNSAKAGHHIVPDALSRFPAPKCTLRECQAERFLSELPDKVQCMTITLENLAILSMTPVILAATTSDVCNALTFGSGTIPLSSHQAWMGLQSDCYYCRKFLESSRLGQYPGRRDKDKTVLNKLAKHC